MRQYLKNKKGIKEGFVGQRLIVLPPNIKKNITLNPLLKSFHLTAIGHYPKAINHEIERKSGCGQYIFIYCTDGVGYIKTNEKKYTIYPNTFYIIPKNAPHSYKSDSDNPWSIYWVHFDGEMAGKIVERSLVEKAPMVHSIPYEEGRITLFETIYSILEHSFGEKEMEIMNFRLMHFITSFIYYKEANPAIFNNDTVSNSIAYMKKNINKKKMELETLASQQNISISQYSRLFKNKTGYSPINFFNQLKIHKSCQYLYFTDRTIKDICIELGFDDQYYFSRLFRRIIGSSPSGYKKQHKK